MSETPTEPTLTPQELRTRAREVAFQAIYAMDTPHVLLEEALQDALGAEEFGPELSEYIQRVIVGTQERLEHIDSLIAARLAKGWDLHRIAKVDRAVLRFALGELLCIEEMPPKVTINEAVNLAKNFGDKDSPRFVNGVLGRALEETPKVEWDPSRYKSFLVEPTTSPAPAEPEVQVEEGSPEHQELMKAGGWVIRREPDSAEAP